MPLVPLVPGTVPVVPAGHVTATKRGRVVGEGMVETFVNNPRRAHGAGRRYGTSTGAYDYGITGGSIEDRSKKVQEMGCTVPSQQAAVSVAVSQVAPAHEMVSGLGFRRKPVSHEASVSHVARTKRVR